MRLFRSLAFSPALSKNLQKAPDKNIKPPIYFFDDEWHLGYNFFLYHNLLNQTDSQIPRIEYISDIRMKLKISIDLNQIIFQFLRFKIF